MPILPDCEITAKESGMIKEISIKDYEKWDDRVINVVFKRDIVLDKFLSGKIEKEIYYDLIAPYEYGGFMGDISNWDNLSREY